VESGIKHHDPNPYFCALLTFIMFIFRLKQPRRLHYVWNVQVVNTENSCPSKDVNILNWEVKRRERLVIF